MLHDRRPRLRAPALSRPPSIVLIDPEIPQNTGSIARLAAALGCTLHLVGRLGFRIDQKAVRRAGLDYWHLVRLERHVDFEQFRRAHPEARPRLFSALAPRSYLEARFAPDDALVFGCESTGLPDTLRAAFAEDCYAIPTIGAVRSLNLANAASVVSYEAYRQLGAFAQVELG
jgi:tRNA (cytidine/uridine-2'-O-)-methyltransferase